MLIFILSLPFLSLAFVIVAHTNVNFEFRVSVNIKHLWTAISFISCVGLFVLLDFAASITSSILKNR